MPGQKRRSRKKPPRSPIQIAREWNRATKAEKLRKRTKAIDKRFLHSAPDDAYARPTSGGQEHSPHKVTDDGVQKYEKTLVSRQAINTLIRKGMLRPTSTPPPQRKGQDLIAVIPRRALKPAKVTRVPALPANDRCLCIWRDSRDHLHQLLTWSDVFPGNAIALAKGTWGLVERLPGGLDPCREEYMNRTRAMIELGRKGFHDWRLDATAAAALQNKR